jgi:hypothetical protein
MYDKELLDLLRKKWHRTTMRMFIGANNSRKFKGLPLRRGRINWR